MRKTSIAFLVLLMIFVVACAQQQIQPRPLPPVPAPAQPEAAPAPTPSPAPQQTTPASTTSSGTAQMTIEADDSGFYPTNHIDVKKGDQVSITFKVKTTNVYHAGLSFNGGKFYSPATSPGDSWTLNFVADSSFKVGSYWPSSSVHKADFSINVG